MSHNPRRKNVFKENDWMDIYYETEQFTRFKTHYIDKNYQYLCKHTKKGRLGKVTAKLFMYFDWFVIVLHYCTFVFQLYSEQLTIIEQVEIRCVIQGHFKKGRLSM